MAQWPRLPHAGEMIASLVVGIFLWAPGALFAQVAGVQNANEFSDQGNAQWSFFDGQIQTYVSVNAARGRSSGTPGPEKQPVVSISITQFRVADQTLLLSANGEAADRVGFSIAGDLTGAQAVGTVRVIDSFSGAAFDLDVDVRWNPTDAVVRDRGAVHDGSRGVHFFGGGVTNANFSGRFRNAVAIGRVNVVGTTSNLIPLPSDSAGLQSTHAVSHSVTVLPRPKTPIDVIRTLDGASVAESTKGERVNALRVDAQGNVVAAGHVQMFGPNTDFTVAKWGPANELLWSRTLAGGPHPLFDEVAQAVAVDGQNNVIAAGSTFESGRSLFTVAKWSPDGTLAWQRNLRGQAALPYFRDQATGVAVDGQGNVVAVGILDDVGDRRRVAFTVAKWDPRGNLLWTGSLPYSGRPNALAVDYRDGSIIAAGSASVLATPGLATRFVTAKWAADGTLRWVRTLEGTANSVDVALSVAVDSRGAVIAGGRLNNVGTYDDFTVAKWDADGTALWKRSLDGTQGYDEVAAVTVDSRDNVVAAGTLTQFGIGLFSVVKWGPDGNELWVNIKFGTFQRAEPALAVAVDGNDNVVATGHNQAKMQTIKYDAASGAWQWIRLVGDYVEYASPVKLAQAFAIAMDRGGNPVIGGFMSIGADSDFAVAKPCANCP